jgi:hypothetical protein
MTALLVDWGAAYAMPYFLSQTSSFAVTVPRRVVSAISGLPKTIRQRV